MMRRSPRLFEAVVRRLAGADRKWRALSSIATYEGEEGRKKVICVGVLAEGVDGDGRHTRTLGWYALNPPTLRSRYDFFRKEEEDYRKLPKKLPTLFCEIPEFFSNYTCSVSLNSEILMYNGEHSKLIDLSHPQITVRSLKEAPLVRNKPSAAVVDGKIYVWGSYDGPDPSVGPTLLKAFDPANNVWDERVPLPSTSKLPDPGYLLSMVGRPLVYEKKKQIFLYQNIKHGTLVSFDLTTQSWEPHSYFLRTVTSGISEGSALIVDDILFTCYGKQVFAYPLEGPNGPGPSVPVDGLGRATDLINDGDNCFLFHMGNLQLCLVSIACLPHRIGISITRTTFTVSKLKVISGPPVFLAFLSGTDVHFIPDATGIHTCLLVHQAAASLDQATVFPPDLEAEGTPESHARRRWSWSRKSTESFVRVMLNIVAAQGKGVVSHKMKDAFVLAAEELKKLGINTTSASVYYKYKQMREEYHMAVETLGQSGFSFNHAKGRIEADPSVWEKWIEEKPKASCLRAKRLPYLKECSAIFKMGLRSKRKSTQI